VSQSALFVNYGSHMACKVMLRLHCIGPRNEVSKIEALGGVVDGNY